MIVFRIAVGVLAVFMILFGLAISVTPVPFGIVLVLLGFFLFASVAPAYVRAIRKRWRWLDRRLDDFEKTAPDWLAKPFKNTDPEDEEADDKDSEDENKANKTLRQARPNPLHETS